MHIKVPQKSQKLFVLNSRMNVKVQESLYNKLSDLGVRSESLLYNDNDQFYASFNLPYLHAKQKNVQIPVQ